MKKFFLLLSCIFVFSSYTKSQKLSINKRGFIPYYYNMYLAIDATEKGDTEKRILYLKKAYKAFPKQSNVPFPYWVQAAILNSFDENDGDLLKFIKKNKVVCIDSTLFLDKIKTNIKSIILQYQKYKKPEYYTNEKYITLSLKMDTLMAVDQYCSNNTKNFDSTLVLDKYKHLIGQDCYYQVLDMLINLFDDYGNFGLKSCVKCGYLRIILLHITNYDKFSIINSHLLKLLKLGHLTPSDYASAFDRSYNEKYGTFYYYFSLNNPFNKENFTPIEKLSEQEKEIINDRRKIIGIPPLPFSFCNISPNKI